MMRLFILIAALLASCVNEPEVTKIEYKGVGWLTFGQDTSDTVETTLTIEDSHGLLLMGSVSDTLIRVDHLPEIGYVAGTAIGKFGDSAHFQFRYSNDTLSGSYALEFDNGVGRERHLILLRQY